MKGSEGKHDTLIYLLRDVLRTQGISVDTHVDYDRGELDIISRRIYYEIKCNKSAKNMGYSKRQIERAINEGMADYGYLVTYQGLFDVLGQNENFMSIIPNHLFSNFDPVNFYFKLKNHGVPDQTAKKLSKKYELLLKEAVNATTDQY